MATLCSARNQALKSERLRMSSVHISDRAMNTAIIKAVPRDEFEDISIHMPEWKTKFLNLVKLGKRIRYYAHTMPIIPKEIRAELEKMS
jgi:hypothetical protein